MKSLKQLFTQVSILTCLCLLSLWSCKPIQSVLQSSDDKSSPPPTHRHQSHLGEGETLIKAAYHNIISKTSLGEIIYRQIYPESSFMTKYIEYADPKQLLMSGRYIEWYDNGNQKTKGQCYKDLKEGEWIEYHSINGKKKASGNYLNGVKEGEWYQYDKSGLHTKTYTYVNGVLQEDYFILDRKGNERKVIGYPEGNKTLPYLAKFDRLKTPEARDKATFNAINSNFANSLVYPSHLRDLKVKGVTETLLSIDSQGKVIDIQVLSGICQAMTDESLRLAKTAIDWSPATCDGIPCSSEYRLFLDFRLN